VNDKIHSGTDVLLLPAVKSARTSFTLEYAGQPVKRKGINGDNVILEYKKIKGLVFEAHKKSVLLRRINSKGAAKNNALTHNKQRPYEGQVHTNIEETKL
jgi:hypothetical protein